jgi:glycosyltransferase involved in cell wall biosynthesis
MHLSELFLRIYAISQKCHILCINDGSTDNSLEIIRHHHVNYIHFDTNNGKGYALKVGMAYAKKNGYKFALTLDADLQHDPFYIINFFRTQRKELSDLVIGMRRFSFSNMPFFRVLSNYLTSNIISYIVKKDIFDSQSGFRLYKLKFFDEADIYSDRFQMESEILLHYAKSDAKISYAEIPVIYDAQRSNISHIRDTINFIKVCTKEIGHL